MQQIWEFTEERRNDEENDKADNYSDVSPVNFTGKIRKDIPPDAVCLCSILNDSVVSEQWNAS